MKYLLQRCFAAFCTLLMTSAATFFALHSAPGDFLSEARLNPQVSPASTRALEMRYGLDSPPALRYWRWLSSAATGDWGESYVSGLPVKPLLLDRAAFTCNLLCSSILLLWAVALGAAAATNRFLSPHFARYLEAPASLLLSVPDIVLILGIAWLFARAGLDLRSTPAALSALCAGLLPSLYVQVQSAIRQASLQPFVLAARDRRLPESVIFLRYILPAAAPSLAGLFGLYTGAALSSSLLVESTLGLPGLGTLLLDAILARDAALVTAGVTLCTFVWVTGNWIGDILHLAADPRLRSKS